MTVGSRLRRFAVAFCALGIGILLFRAQVATSLVVRGDDFLYRRQVERARGYYVRALWFDPESRAAADRYVFFGMQERTPASLAASIAIASRYLALRPDDATVLADRALCYQIERRYSEAAPDFSHAGALARDPRYFTFAGWAALRSGKRREARMLWHEALALDGRFGPARFALARVRP